MKYQATVTLTVRQRVEVDADNKASARELIELRDEQVVPVGEQTISIRSIAVTEKADLDG